MLFSANEFELHFAVCAVNRTVHAAYFFFQNIFFSQITYIFGIFLYCSLSLWLYLQMLFLSLCLIRASQSVNTRTLTLAYLLMNDDDDGSVGCDHSGSVCSMSGNDFQFKTIF